MFLRHGGYVLETGEETGISYDKFGEFMRVRGESRGRMARTEGKFLGSGGFMKIRAIRIIYNKVE